MHLPWIVLKFGGTSVSDPVCWTHITHIVRKRLEAGWRTLLVCSAPNGISDALEELIHQAILGSAESILKKIYNRYQLLCSALNLNDFLHDFLETEFKNLRALIDSIFILGEATPRAQARVMAYGELWLTHLGATYLNQQKIHTRWQDVREWLVVEAHRDFRHPDAYLNAVCSYEHDATLCHQLRNTSESVVLTQGFIARNAQGETVLLGRGGSDASAALLAAKISAPLCEIWTDVAGVYTANPKQIPEARLISKLHYAEAQELACMGAKVLHPKCIAPIAHHGIPLWVRYTQHPEDAGTCISAEPETCPPFIKSIQIKNDVMLISVETLNMWHQSGFLSEVFHCVHRYGFSVDLVTTSQTSITFSLDTRSHTQEYFLDALLKDLNQFARAQCIGPCASISLIGRSVHAVLSELNEVWSVLKQHTVYLMVQSANDVSMTFVVDEGSALYLARTIHTLIIDDSDVCTHGIQRDAQHNMWYQKRSVLLDLARTHGPCYVYSKAILTQQAHAVQTCSSVDRIYFSVKANPHIDILTLWNRLGFGFDCVSLGELEYVKQHLSHLDTSRILWTPNFAPRFEYEQVLSYGMTITIDNLYILKQWPELWKGKNILIRIDPHRAFGPHPLVMAAGKASKFGIAIDDLAQAADLTKQCGAHVLGLHVHAGSGMASPLYWRNLFNFLLECRRFFPETQVFNLGGGFGVPDAPGLAPFDIAYFNSALAEVKERAPHIQIWIEPGRYLVAEAGLLLARVTQIKTKGSVHFVGVETGMNSLIRPMLYGAWHDVVNLTRLEEECTNTVHVVGPMCESGDVLAHSRSLPQCVEGDVLAFFNVGAYGHSMSSNYNLRPPASEYFLEDD